MPPAVGMAIAAIASAAAATAAANKQANAQKTAATMTTDAANHAADVGAKSAADTLAFSKQQAEYDFLNSEAARKANYGQWTAAQNRLGTLGSMMGLGPREIPAYVPGIDPRFADAAAAGTTGGPATAGAATGGATTSAGGGIPKSTGDVAKDMELANQLAYGGAHHTDPNYWISAGYAKDPQYFFQKMLGMDAGGADVAKTGPYAGQAAAGGAAGGGRALPVAAPTSTLAGYLAGVLPGMVNTPALQAPTVRYAPGTFGSAFLRQ